MLRESPDVQAFREISSDARANYGPQLGDPMERPTKEDPEATPSLSRILPATILHLAKVFGKSCASPPDEQCEVADTSLQQV